MPTTLEAHKRPGVHYAFTTDGVELPIIDVTHPEFALAISDSEQREMVDKFLRENSPLGKLPAPILNLLLRFFLRGSVLATGIRQARGTFMSGLHTYLLKLGPEMLGTSWAKPVDRRIAAALPALSVRLRLQDLATLMADTLLPPLSIAPHRPLHFINIAGGPAIDSLNALIVLTEKHPGILAQRAITIDVLDVDDAGPAFGKAALAALSEDGGPLRRTQITLRHTRYDWANTTGLKPVLDEAHAGGSLVICSSEGGLFEYGSDNEIQTNLKVLRESWEVLAVVGSVTRADAAALSLYKTSGAAVRPHGMEVFRGLIEPTGWNVSRIVQRPFSDQVVLT